MGVEDSPETRALRVLMVEDSEDDAILIARQLRRGGFDVTFERVETAEAFTAALAREAWDAVIADYMLPCFSGPEALAIFRADGREIPFIVVSGKVGEETAVATMKAGAHDYLMKRSLTRLSAAMDRELREAWRRRQLREKQDTLRTLGLQLTVAEENERRRIAAGLHDDIEQDLVAATFHLRRAGSCRDPAGTAEAVGEAVKLLNHVLARLHTLTFELSSPVLHTLGIVAAVEDLCKRTHERYGLVVEADGGEEPERLSDEARIVLFRGTRELLQNVVKHSRADRARVTCARSEEGFEIVVEDNGIGFEAHGAGEGFSPAGGFGLFHVRERMEQVGGRLAVESAPSRGSRITLAVPG